MAISPHTPRVKDHSTTLADWLELEALRSENGVGSLLELARQFAIAGVGDAEEETDDEPRQFTDHARLDDVMAELEARSAGCGDGYPFVIDRAGNSIARKSDWMEFNYSALLLLSFIDCHKAVRSRVGLIFPARWFEAVCVVTAEKYLGGHELGATAFHFASPRPDGSGFAAALQALAAKLRGKALNLIEPRHEKDGGLDVLAWRPFADSRCNFVCLFGQCATGADWQDKNPELMEFLDVRLRLETTAVHPTIFVPFTLTPDDWTRKSRRVVIFDRCRIASLLPRIGQGASADLARNLVSKLLAA
jgi:hypothetical protein